LILVKIIGLSILIKLIFFKLLIEGNKNNVGFKANNSEKDRL
jgi:hypothetical protein